MRSLSRVVWTEGMHLAQHHFQAQTRYFEDIAAFAVGALAYRPYGLAGCELDAEALLNGTASVVHARGVMPDGLAFQFPGDAPPDALDVADAFPPTESALRLLLAIPAYRPGRSNCADPNGDETGYRFSPDTQQLPDDTTGTDVRGVTLAHKNFQLVLEGSEEEGDVVLPIARIMRDGAGHFVYDPEYIPPSLSIGASNALLGMLARLVDMLDAKADSIQVERREGGARDRAQYAASEISNFWLSHAVHTSLATLRHHMRTRAAHAEEMYSEFARLAGALCTFSMDAHPRDLPAYDHDDPGPCFRELDRQIRRHLDVVRPTNRVVIKLERTQQFMFTGTVSDRRCFDKAHWFLAVRSSASQADVIGGVPKLAKICSAKHIARLVKEAYPGLGINHVAAPPAAVSPRIGAQYFQLERTDPCWRTIVDSSEVGVYAPGALGEVELEIVVVLDS